MNNIATNATRTARASDFHNSVALIVGPCDETGAGIARYFSSRGAAVGLCGAGGDVLESLAGAISAQGGNAIAFATEGSATISDIFGRVLSKFGKIDILVNNTGEIAGRSVLEQSMSDFERDIAAILTRSFGFLHEVVPSMRKAQYGRIVNIFGLSYLGLPGRANLAAAYAGVFGITRSVALETAAAGITVNSVVRGDIAGVTSLGADAEKLAGQIPVKRLGTAADVAHAIQFFASQSTKYVTGQTLFVCGGKSAYFSMSV